MSLRAPAASHPFDRVPKHPGPVVLSLWRAACLVLAACMPSTAVFAQTPAGLPALGLDPDEVTVSGLSSGGYMAAQFEVAHSASIKGAAIVAAGPYGCSMGSVITAALTCSCPYEEAAGGVIGPEISAARSNCIRLPPAVLAQRALAATRGNSADIDPIRGLKRHRVWLYSGDADPVVDPSIVDGLQAFYAGAKVPKRQIARVKGPRAGHGMPIVDSGGCEITRSPYLNGCRIDGAGDLLKWLYAQPAGTPGASHASALRPFDQKRYRQHGVFDGLDDSGWLYVPARCEQTGARCKLHVAFHGCEQGQNFPAEGQAGAPVTAGCSSSRPATTAGQRVLAWSCCIRRCCPAANTA